MKGKCLESLIEFHERTEYKVRSNEGMRDVLMPTRGLREGCSPFSMLLNVYHQAVMRQAKKGEG